MKPTDRTDNTETILRYVEEFWAEHGYSPSLREIQKACDISSLSVVKWNLGTLEKRGDIRRVPEIARSITLRRNGGRIPIK